MKFTRLLLLLTIPFFFSGCSLFTNNPVKSIQIVSAKGANDNKHTQVDIVFVYGSMDSLPKTTKEWYDGQKARVLNAPDSFRIVSLRVAPALIQEVEMPVKHGKANHVLAFVNFHDGGDQPPLDLTKHNNPVIYIKDDHYQLSWRR